MWLRRVDKKVRVLRRFHLKQLPRFPYDLVWALVVVATLIGAWLRLASAPVLAITGDEFFTLKSIQLPVGDILSQFRTGLSMHLYFLLMKLWIHMFGASPLMLKLPSLLAGVALIPITYLLGRRWLNPQASVIAATLAAVSAPLISYSYSARVYAILMLGVILSMFLFERALRSARRKDLVWLSLVNAVLIALSLNSVYVLLVQGAAVVVESFYPRRLPWRRLVDLAACFSVSVAVSALFYIRAIPEILNMSQLLTGTHFRPDMLWGSFKINHQAAPLVMLGFLALGAWIAWRRYEVAGRLLARISILALAR